MTDPAYPKNSFQENYPQPPPQGQAFIAPPPPYSPQAAYPATTTVITPAAVTSVMTPLKFGPAPQIMQCPLCSCSITTSTTFKIGLFTWMVVGIWALVGLAFFPIWFCCCIPCCISSTKNVEHHCPNCKNYLGVYDRMNM